MTDIPKIDLHMHTTVSDGTDTPEELLAAVEAAEIDIFSITDHDAVKGCRRIPPLLKKNRPRFITGVEFSCRDEEGKYHILGYGYDPDAVSVNSLVAKGHGFRMQKVTARLDFLKERFGFAFSDEDVKKLLAMDNPGKPHIGNLMIKYGYAKTREEAIRDFIDQKKFKTMVISPEEAIGGILAGGGIPVLAHPTYGSGDQLILGEEMEQRIRHLLDFGLKGLEAYYSGFTAKIRNELLGFAERFGLYVTAGSDYHGSNKLIVPGDTGLESGDEPAEQLKRFLEEVR